MFPLSDFPFKVDYAKTGRAICFRGCRKNINKGTLRIARMVQAEFGKKERWYHEDCFFKRERPKSVSEITDFNKLEDDDQQRLIIKVDQVTKAAMVVPRKDETNGQSSKRSSTEVDGPLGDFSVEYSKHYRTLCKHCDVVICKDNVRISKTVRDLDIAGCEQLWYHDLCFAKARRELQFFAGGETLPGFDALSEEDQQKLRDIIRPINLEEVPNKKIKTDPEELEMRKILSKQNNMYQNYKRELEKLSPEVIKDVLRSNRQIVTKNKRKCLELLADCMAFGALERCPECNGQLVLATLGYKCTGRASAYSSCDYSSTQPARSPLHVPPALTVHPALQHYQPVVGVRLFRAGGQTARVKKEVCNPPLKNLQFFIYGRELNAKKDGIKRRIFKMGGLVVSELTDTTAAVVSTQSEIDKKNEKMMDIAGKGIEVVEESFLDQIDCENGSVKDSLLLIVVSNIAGWGSDPINRVPRAVIEGKPTKTRGSKYVKTTSKKIIKGGAVVESAELAKTSHVYRDSDGQRYSGILSRTDIAAEQNLFYKLQLMASDIDDRYYVYTAWGQIGTKGKDKIDYEYNLEAAMAKFKSKFFEMTKNQWKDRHNFVKYPWKYYLHDVSYDDSNPLSLEVDYKSDLPIPVQRLVQKILNIDTMRRTMQEFDLDMETMPLGKIPQQDITKGWEVLTELSKFLEKGKVGKSKISDASNRFYTYIPHKANSGLPPLLDTKELVKEKFQLLDDLMQINFAFTLRNADIAGNGNALEECYRKLNTDISPLDKISKEFAMIEKYVKNSHAPYHTDYSLEIEHVFKIVRPGEDDRYKPFKKLHNRRLLWHGSKITNFALILSKGLLVAPPEAPPSGYMFGKGIYFADMVSKSANYCRVDRGDPVGVLLLCEVALGNMKKCSKAEHVIKLPPGIHSVFGVGSTQPDPGQAVTLEDETLVPLGLPVTHEIDTDLLHNEFVVYDPAQVNVKYLLQLKFNY